MRLEIGEYGLRVYLETDQDRAYVRDTLGLNGKGAACTLYLETAIGLDSCPVCLKTGGTCDPEHKSEKEGE